MKILILLSLVFTVSCGKKVKVVKPATPEAYHYNFSLKGCSTGEHNYFTLNEACEALLKDDLNNGCAKDERIKLFNSSCEGQFST